METLTIKGISKFYRDQKALDNVSFQVHAGQIVGLLGPNGAGKTTTMSIMAGIMAPDTGEVLFDGKSMTTENEIAIKQKIGFLSESNPLYKDMLVSEYLDFVASVRNLEKDEHRLAIKRVCEETGITDKLNQPIEELSKGYKQRVGLAQAIIHQPEILILDEPTEGLDPNQRSTIRDLIAKLGKNKTVLISTHVLSEVQAICDRVVILNQGKIITQGSVNDIIQQGQQKQKVIFEVSGYTIFDTLKNDQNFKLLDHSQNNNRHVFTLTGVNADDIRPKLFHLAKVLDWTVYELHQESTSLEDIFRSLTVGE